MTYLHSYFVSAKKIIEQYNGQIPLSAFLKNYFSTEKKYGSRDRKVIGSLCYNYFRTGAALADKSIGERLLTGLFLFTNSPSEFLQQQAQEWNEKITLPIAEKAALANVAVSKIFRFHDELSDEVEPLLLNHSFLTQPDLFIRIRPGKRSIVEAKLLEANISFNEKSENCFAFANGTKLEQTLNINNEAVIQDLNSQRVAEMFELINLPKNAAVWDCCAASGGKAIMACDYLPGISLWVSDIRESILYNLQKRLSEASIKNYKSFVADMTNSEKLKQQLGNQIFDLIVCDAPCSGSGTWGRTPEQLVFFKEKEIDNYSKLQQAIVLNTIPFLKKNGYLLYITCSVFRKENESVVEFILANTNLKPVKQKLLKGYNDRADSMFGALFQLI